MIDETNIYDDSGNKIPEFEEVIQYKEQHKRTDPESKILRELEKMYNFETNAELDQFLDLASQKLKVSKKEAYRKLIHFLGDNFSDIAVYESIWDEQYIRENDSWLMSIPDDKWKSSWEEWH